MRSLYPLQERTGQIFVVDVDMLLVLGRGVHPNFGPYIPAWTMLELTTGQQIVMSEDWVNTQEKLGNMVRL